MAFPLDDVRGVTFHRFPRLACTRLVFISHRSIGPRICKRVRRDAPKIGSKCVGPIASRGPSDLLVPRAGALGDLGRREEDAHTDDDHSLFARPSPLIDEVGNDHFASTARRIIRTSKRVNCTNVAVLVLTRGASRSWNSICSMTHSQPFIKL